MTESTTTLDSFLARKAGLDAAGVAALRKRLAGSKLLLGTEGLLRFKPDALVRSATWRRLRARAMLRTEAARLAFDDLVREGYDRISFDQRQRRSVILMACLIAMVRDLVELQRISYEQACRKLDAVSPRR